MKITGKNGNDFILEATEEEMKHLLCSLDLTTYGLKIGKEIPIIDMPVGKRKIIQKTINHDNWLDNFIP